MEQGLALLLGPSEAAYVEEVLLTSRMEERDAVVGPHRGWSWEGGGGTIEALFLLLKKDDLRGTGGGMGGMKARCVLRGVSGMRPSSSVTLQMKERKKGKREEEKKGND